MMNSHARSSLTLILSAFVATVSFDVFAEDALHGRVSFSDSSGLVKGSNDTDWSFATVNSLVLPGDSIWADDSDALELEFSGGQFIRMADGSKVDVISLPPAALFRGVSGSFYVQRVRRSTGDLTFETPVGTIVVHPNTQVRVDILQEGAATVSVRWGSVSVRTPSGAPIQVGQGNRTYIDPGYLPSSPLPFDLSQEDSFDSWNRERARLLAVGYEEIPVIESASYDEAPMGMSDLTSYGEWIYDDDEYFWRPTVINNYVPYRNGYWSYVYDSGYVWTGHHPFSYVTSHYGYWDYNSHYGWLWSYNGHYSPAYCATIRYGDYFVWSPLGRHGRPVHYGYDHFNVGGVQFSVYGSSYSHASDLLHGAALVHGFHRGLVHHGRNGHGDYLWDIHASGSRHRDRQYRGTSLRVRDYSPQRVMRGPSVAGANGRNARSQVAALESRSGSRAVNSTRAVSRGNAREHTSVAPENRRATTRNVRLNSSTVTTARADVRRAQRGSDSTRTLVSRRSGSGSRVALTNSTSTRSTRPTVARSDNGVRSTRITTLDAGRHRPTSTSRATRSTTPTRDSSAVTNRRTNTNQLGQTGRSTPSVARERSSSGSRYPEARPTPTRTRETVSTPSRIQTPSRSTTTTRRTPTRVNSQPSRSTSVNSSSPSRRSTQIQQPSRSTPRASSPTRSVPRAQQSAPSRSVTRSQAPSRSVGRSQAPSRSVSRAPAPSRSSVSRSSAPSRSINRAPSPSRSVPRASAPSRSPSRSYSSSPSRASSSSRSAVSSSSRGASRSAPARSSGRSSGRSVRR